MIWLWILLAFLIISIVFFTRKIPFQYLFIALIPIQKYGFALFGLNIKPFHLFAFFLIIYLLLFKREQTIQNIKNTGKIFLLVIALFAIMVPVNIINGGGLDSLKYLGVVFLSFVSGYIFILSILQEKRIEINLFFSIICSSVVYSIFFLTLYSLYFMDLELPDTVIDLVADSDADKGVLSIYYNSGFSLQRKQLRLIGFAVDPNSCAITFVPSICLIIHKLFFQKNTLKQALLFIFAFLIITLGAVLTLSRTVWVVIAFFFIFGFINFVLSDYCSKKTKIVSSLVLISIISFAIIVGEFVLRGKLFNTILVSFFSRSSLLDENGRFSLWISSIDTLMKTNPIFGLGQGAFSNNAGLECHNTWLEYFVGSGILVGLVMLLIFAACSYYFFLVAKTYSLTKKPNTIFPFFFSLLSIIFVLSFVSYLASPEFWLFLNIAANSSKLFMTGDVVFGVQTSHLKCNNHL